MKVDVCTFYVETDTDGQSVLLCFMWRLTLKVSQFCYVLCGDWHWKSVSVFMLYVEIHTEGQSVLLCFM